MENYRIRRERLTEKERKRTCTNVMNEEEMILKRAMAKMKQNIEDILCCSDYRFRKKKKSGAQAK